MSKLTKITDALAILAMLISPIAYGQQFGDVADSPESMTSSNDSLGGPVPQLFVVASFSDSVTVVNSVTERITARIPVGNAPIRLASITNASSNKTWCGMLSPRRKADEIIATPLE